MVEVARGRARARGLTNVDFAVAHADAIALEDDSVDGVLCRFGYMLMPDPAAALAETRRVLRPGGRLALAVWRSAQRNPWVSIAGRMLVGRGLVPPPEPGAPGMFALADDRGLRALLEEAGFAVERLEDVDARFEHWDIDDYVFRGRDTGGLFARAWDAASEEQRAEMKAELEERFAQFRTDDGYVLPGVALCALAT
jgi:SAM-dependent methyltransferase